MNIKAAQFWYGVASPFYDKLRDLIYPSAQTLTFDLIEHLPPHNSALCVGGGTGEWLPIYNKQHPNSALYYVDISSEMIKRAQSRIEVSSIHFIQHDAQNIRLPQKVDLVILPFFLDHFIESEIESWISVFQTYGNKNLKIAIVDFKSNSAQSFRTKLLVWLASWILQLKLKRLPHIDGTLSKNGYQVDWSKTSQTCFATLYTSQ